MYVANKVIPSNGNDWSSQSKQDRNRKRSEIANAKRRQLKNILSIFNRYRNPLDSTAINSKGFLTLLRDLNAKCVSMSDVIVHWMFRNKVKWEMTKNEFVTGMQAFDCESIKDLKSRLDSLKGKLNRPGQFFEKFYQFTYHACGTQLLDVDTAVTYWKIVMKRKFDQLDMWCDFLKTQKVEFFSKFEWNLLLQLSSTIIKPYVYQSSYWPELFIDFVKWYDHPNGKVAVHEQRPRELLLDEFFPELK